jgi:hypothetical protein
MRFGKVKHNAGSIRHLHANIKVPTGKLVYLEDSYERLLDPNLNTRLYSNDHCQVWENRVTRGEPSIEKRFVISWRGMRAKISGQLTAGEAGSLIDIWQQTIRGYDIPGGAIIIRFGDRPLYVNIVVPNGEVRHEEPLAEGVKETLAKNADDQARKMPIMLAFEKMFLVEQGGIVEPFNVLTPEEQVLVKDRL